MCDYIYLDGYFQAPDDISSRYDNNTNMFYWYVDIRRLKNFKDNKKIFVSVQQLSFRGNITIAADADNYIKNSTCELITNLRLNNSYNSYGKNNVLLLCDANVNTNTLYIESSSSNNNSYLTFEINTITDRIELGVNYSNAYIDFNDDIDCQFFKCLLKFEYEDK